MCCVVFWGPAGTNSPPWIFGAPPCLGAVPGHDGVRAVRAAVLGGRVILSGLTATAVLLQIRHQLGYHGATVLLVVVVLLSTLFVQ